MKKSKLLILLPLIALSMSSCDMSLTSGPSGSNNRSSSSEEVNEPSSYSSYLVEYGFYYQGNLESIPEGASLYLYGSLVRDSFTPLTVNEEGNYQTTISDIEYGTYEYSLYIEYTDKDVSLESPLVYSGLETVNGNSSSGGDKYIFLDSSLSELLGEKEGEGSGEDITYTYTIEVDNTEALTTLTYDGNGQTQTSVELQVYLVTTGSDGSSTRQEASADDVSISTTGYDVISISGLTVTVVGAGTTTLTISATDYTPTSIDVIVTDITDSGSGGGSGDTGEEQTTTINNYTIIFTLYDSNNTVQTCPDNGSLYIQSNFGGEWTEDADGNGWYTWGNWEALTESKTAENTTYSITVNNVIPGVYYECNIIFVPTGDSASDDWANLVKENGEKIGVTISSDATDGGSQNVDVTGCYNLEQQYGSFSGTTDGGKPDATYIHNFTLVITLYDSNGTTVKKAPSGYDLYISGDMDGKWTVNESYDGSDEENNSEGWYNWGDLVKLEETTDENDNLAYTYTFGYVEANSYPNFNIYYTQTGSEVDWNNKLGSENFYFEVDSGATDDYTQYVTCSIDSTLDEFMENAVDTGDQGESGDDPSQGGDTGSETTPVNNYTIVFTIYDTNGDVQQCPSYGSLYVHGNFGGNLITPTEGDPYYEWSDQYIKLDETTYDSHVAYSATFSGVIPGETYAFDICFIYENESTSTWRPINPADTYEKYDFYCTISSDATDDGTQYQDLTGCYTLASEFPSSESEDEGLKPDATYVSNYTLQVTIKDGSGHIKKCASGYSLWMQSALNGYWDSSSTGWWVWGDYVKLTENATDESVTFTCTYDSVVVGESYGYNILYAANDTELDWDNEKLGSSDFSFTVDSNATDNYTQSITCTATSSVVDSMVDAFDYSGDTGSDTGDTTYTGDVSLYFLVIDTSSTTDANNIQGFSITQSVENGSDGIFKQNGDNTEGGPWYNWSQQTMTTATIAGSTHVVVYTTTVGETSTGTTLWMNLENWANSDNVWQSYWFECDVPANYTNTVTCVVYVDMTTFTSTITSNSSTEITSSSIFYYAGTPTTVLASL
ncbi:MAG: hypothetical protein LUD22_04235 [Coprobacillus sp.]|nr:hypothetical protein [Coprobacillus sp.]